jgi:pyruvate,water dikinase
VLVAVAAELGDPSLITRLVAALGAVESAKPAQALWSLSRVVRSNVELSTQFDSQDAGLLDRLRAHPDAACADFVSAFDEFLYRYGARGVNEWEMRSQTFETNPEIALAALDRLRRADDDHDPAVAHSVLAAERDDLVAQIGEKLDAAPELKGQFLGAVQSAKVFLAARELTKSNTIRITHEGRMAMRELGRRMVDRGLFDRVETFGMLTNEEWDAFLADPEGSGLAEVARQRERQYAELCLLEPPFIVNGEAAPVETWRRRTDGIEPAGVGTTLQGIPGCPGVARGRAKIVHDPGNPAVLEVGDILVAPATDSSWTPLFIPSAGVVVDVGALVSHAVIVSRELGIPCAVSVSDATRRIPDGAIVEVDGARGTVTVLEV